MSQRFLNLIKRGETAEVAAAAKADKTLVTCRDAQGVSALLLSVYSHQTLIRDFLLSQIPEIDIFEASACGLAERMGELLHQDATCIFAPSADGWAPLHLAAAFGGAAATALLLEHGAHVHQISHNPMRCQPLHSCLSLSRDPQTVRLLIAQGADVNFAQAGGYTPLHQAAVAGDVALLRMLLEAGADPGTRCHRGKSPAEYCRERNHAAAEELLLNWAPAAKSSTGG